MNAERLLEHYNRIADAPDAIARLRQFILDLAVRGKLVPQDRRDEPASELLARIKKERAALAKAGKAKRQETLPPPDFNQTPFLLPAGWAWGRFPEIGTFGRGKSKHRPRNDPALFDGGTHLMVQTGDVARSNGVIETYTNKYNDFGLSQSLKWPKGTLCITIAANIADSGILGFDACFPDSVVGFVPVSMFENARYFEYFVRTAKSNLLEFAPATAQKNINLEILTAVLIPLPPLTEQRRIVARVDELMALCDRLEAARAEREATRDRLAAASLARLNAPDPDPSLFADHARFALDNLAALATRPDQIKQIRQTILNLAVRGKLVPQDAKDEPASALLKRIAKEKAQHEKAGAIPRQKEIIRDPSSSLGAMPSSWEPIALGQVCNMVTSGSRGWAEFYADAGPGFIRAQNIRFGTLKLDDLACVNPPSNSEGSRTQVSKGDLLIVITGAGVTNPALLDRDLGEAYVSQHVGLVRPTDKRLSDWLLLCLMAPAGGREELVQRAYGAGKPGLNLDNIKTLTIPLPSLAEQHRIVKKVDALMALCDQLEASLTATETTRRRLLEALLAEALAPAEVRDMEAAQ